MTRAERFLALALVAAPVLAAAQPQPSGASVAAEALFREGKRLMKDHKLAEACDKLAASNRLEESVGTLLNLADCREQNDQLATAWATFLRGASLARVNSDGVREAEARKRAALLEPRLAYLTISVPLASHVDGLAIKRGDDAVDAALWNQGVPIDVGNYEISGQAPGHERWSTRVQIAADGARVSVEVPRFKQLKDLAPAAVTAAPVHEDSDEGTSNVAVATPSPITPVRIGAFAAAGVGIAAVATGIAFSLEAKHLQSQSDALCPASGCGDPHALDLNQRARRDAITGDVLFAAGGAAVIGAAVLWFVGAPATAHDGVAISPVVGRGELGLAFGRRF